MATPCQIAIINTPEKYHNSQSCCSVLTKCSPDLVKKFQTPFEEIFPNIFGDYDNEQKLLIQTGAKPVVVLENAAEVISQMKNIDGFIEQIINFIIQENKSDYVFIGSQTFPLVLKKQWLNRQPNSDYVEIYGEGDLSITAEYDRAIQNIKPAQMPNKAILHIGAEIEDVGHYGVAIKNGNDVIIFDSMQCSGKSAYTVFFAQVTSDIFGNVQMETLLSPSTQTCPQPTGGFVNERDEKKETMENYLYRLQNLDSQNHFCYMWAIWYFHLFIVNGKKGVDTVFEQMKDTCVVPLVAIKRYIWGILNYLYPTDKQIKELFTEVLKATYGKNIKTSDINFITSYFMMNFRYVWDDLNTKKFNLFSVISCDLKEVRSFNNINKCVHYSLKPVPYVLDKFTT